MVWWALSWKERNSASSEPEPSGFGLPPSPVPSAARFLHTAELKKTPPASHTWIWTRFFPPVTRGLIGKDQLALMKSSALLINTSRGPVVDSEALAEALNTGKIAGAGVDVFEMEPPVPESHPLLNAKNVIATPHVAFATKEALEKRAVIVFDNIARWAKGEPQNVM